MKLLLVEKQATTLILCVVLVVIQVVTSQTYEQRRRQGQDCSQRCQCPAQYQPFCGTDEVTYSNKCQLECAQNFCDRNLRVKFEGVCAVPYIHDKRGNQQGRRPQPPPFSIPARNTPAGRYPGNPTPPPYGYGWTQQPTAGDRRQSYVIPVLPTSQPQRQVWYGSQGK